MLGYDITIKLMASCVPGVVPEDLCTFRAPIVGFCYRSDVGNGNHECEGIFLMRNVGCCSGCG